MASLQVDLRYNFWSVKLPKKSFGNFTVPKSLRKKYLLEDKDLCNIEISIGSFLYANTFKLTSGGEIYVPRDVARKIEEIATKNSTAKLKCTLLTNGSPQNNALFFENASDEPVTKGFKFIAGHKRKKNGVIAVSASKERSAELRHNEFQDVLYEYLVDIHGKDFVGTENATGHGTLIDVVVNAEDGFEFYEIKTAESVKSCIRQAIPQLLEYAYWSPERKKIKGLFVASILKITKEAEQYLQYLRRKFGLPIFYFTIDLTIAKS